MPSVTSNRSSGSERASQHRRRFSRGSSPSPRQSVSPGITERVISWGIGLNMDEGEVGVQPYPSETASSVLSLDVYPDLPSTHVPNELELDRISPNMHTHNSIACSCILCVVWNIVSAYVAVMTIQFLGQLGVLLALLVLVPALSMGGRTGYRAFAEFLLTQASQNVTPNIPGETCMSPFSFHQTTGESSAVGIPHYSRRFAVVMGMSSSLSGLACMFVGFALEFWWIRRWTMAIFMTLFSLPFVVTALMADGYILMGCLGYGFRKSCHSYSSCLVHSWIDRLAGCVAQSLTPGSEPRQIIFFACQGILFTGGITLTAIYGRKAFGRLWDRAPVLVTSGLLAFLLPFCIYGLVVIFILIKRCLLLAWHYICLDWGSGKGTDAVEDAESTRPQNPDMASPFDIENCGREMVYIHRTSSIV